MFEFLFKSKPKKCVHKWRTIAYDSAFHTEYTDTKAKRNHHVKWLKCEHCGERGFNRDGAERHRGVESVYNRWIEQHTIMITADGEVYDANYEVTSTTPHWTTLQFQPVTGVSRLMGQLKQDAEFQALCKHQMVSDAFGQLETVVKMHENI